MSGRRLMFKTFLKEYCRDLTSAENFRLSSFAKGLEGNHRALEPVFLYSLFLPNEKYFYKNLNDDLKKEYQSLLTEFSKYSNVEHMLSEENNLSYDYQKVYKAYLNEVKSKAADQPLKRRYCKRLNELLKETMVSKYNVCKNNGLNTANFNEFLKGDLCKMSLEKCKKVYLYLSTFE